MLHYISRIYNFVRMLKQIRVLLVAGDSDKLGVLKILLVNCLKDLQVEINGANSLTTAKKVLPLHSYDGLIIEINSTDCRSEFEFLQFARAEFPQISCAVIASYVLEDEVEKAIHMGARILDRPINSLQVKNWALTLSNTSAPSVAIKPKQISQLKKFPTSNERFAPTSRVVEESSLRSVSGLLKYALSLKEDLQIPFVCQISRYFGPNWTIDLVETLIASLPPEKLDLLQSRLSSIQYVRDLAPLERVNLKVRHHIVITNNKKYLYWKLEYRDLNGRGADYLLNTSLDLDKFAMLSELEQKRLFVEHLKEEYREDRELLDLAEIAIKTAQPYFRLHSDKNSSIPGVEV